MRLLPSFTFVGSATLPKLKKLSFGMDADADRTVEKRFSYYGYGFYADPRSDAGVFTGEFVFNDSDMRDLRRFQATQRGTKFSLASGVISGVPYPFGYTRHTATGGYPYYSKILKIEDESFYSVGWWKCKITLAESV
jgi:hypothetical protein